MNFSMEIKLKLEFVCRGYVEVRNIFSAIFLQAIRYFSVGSYKIKNFENIKMC